MRVAETITEKLTAAFRPLDLQVIDESHHHAGMAGMVMGFVDHLQIERPKCGGQLFRDGLGDTHGDSPGQCPMTLKWCGARCLPGESTLPILVLSWPSHGPISSMSSCDRSARLPWSASAICRPAPASASSARPNRAIA